MRPLLVLFFPILFTCLLSVTAKFEYDKRDDSWAKWDDGDDRDEVDEDNFAEDRGKNKAQPNIIFFLFDDWGWNDVGYHNPEILTPNIDALAEGGVRLEQSYVLQVCTPSRASLLTGLFPSHVGEQGPFVLQPTSLGGLTLDKQILPQYLKGLNYSTHLIGKWHEGHCNPAYLPTNRGFDSQYGIYLGGSYNYAHTYHIPPYPYDFHQDDAPLNDINGVGNVFQMDLYNDRAIDIINQHAATASDETPLFLYLSLTSPHFPVEAPIEYLDLYPDVDDSIKRRTYMAMVSHMDAVLGNIINTLNDTGLLDNSIVVATSDNGAYEERYPEVANLPFFGGGSNDPLKGQKAGLEEGGVRVPTILSSPLLKKPGRISNKMMHIVDWLPTLITAAGGDVDDYPELADIDGKNQYRTLFKDKKSVRHSFIYNLRENTVGNVTFDMGAIRYGRWKLINQDGFFPIFPIFPIGRFELYDLQQDPNEEFDLFDARPEVAEKMLEKFEEAASAMVAENFKPLLTEDQLLLALDGDGALATNFCNMDGSVAL